MAQRQTIELQVDSHSDSTGSVEQEAERYGSRQHVALSRRREPRDSLDSLKARLALMVTTWQSDLRADITSALQQIEQANRSKEAWELLRRQLEFIQPELVQAITNCYPPLTEIELKICLLAGMDLSTKQIAEFLNCSQQKIARHRNVIDKKFKDVEV